MVNSEGLQVAIINERDRLLLQRAFRYVVSSLEAMVTLSYPSKSLVQSTLQCATEIMARKEGDDLRELLDRHELELAHFRLPMPDHANRN